MIPAKKQNKNIAKVPAAASRATKIGSGVRLVISHAAPVVCIQPPTLDRTLAVHSRRKAGLAKGAKAECGRATTGDGGAFILPSTEGLLVEAMGLVVHPADRADDVVGRLVVLEDPAQLGAGLAQPLAVLAELVDRHHGEPRAHQGMGAEL